MASQPPEDETPPTVPAPAPLPPAAAPSEVPEEKWVQRIRLKSSAAIVGFFLLVEGLLIARIAGWSVIDPARWEQLMIPLTGIETLATAAAGVLLGVSVQQANVESANKRAEESKVTEADTKRRLETAKAEAAAAADELASNLSVEAEIAGTRSDPNNSRIESAQRRLRNALRA